jgi:hypothetical protein
VNLELLNFERLRTSIRHPDLLDTSEGTPGSLASDVRCWKDEIELPGPIEIPYRRIYLRENFCRNRMMRGGKNEMP